MPKRASKLIKKGKSKGLAKAKMRNIQKLKRIKNKEFTPAEKKAKKEARKERRQLTYAELRDRKLKDLRQRYNYANEEEVYKLTAEVTGEEMLEMMDPDDIEDVMKNTNGIVLEEEEAAALEEKESEALEEEESAFLEEEESAALEEEEEESTKAKEDQSMEAEEDDDEEKNYELKERSFHPMGNDMKYLLPLKTKAGVVQRYTKRYAEDDESEEEFPMEEAATATEETAEADEEKPEAKMEPVEKSVVDLMAERQLKLERKKTSIGCLAVNFLEQPQERLHCLSNLIHMLEEDDISVSYTVRKYVAMSLLEVFHKTIPSYHIEPHDLSQKLKKETKEQYLWENHLLKSYQTYLKELERFLKEFEKSKKKPQPQRQLAVVALKCMGELFIKHYHFTYTNNIIAALVPYLNHKDDEMCHLIENYFATFFKADIKGDVSLEILKRIDHYSRKRTYNVRVEMFRVLLSLRIKDVKPIDEELEAKNIAKKKLTHTEKLLRKVVEERKAKKSNKEAKKFRKFRKLEELKKEQQMKKDEEVRTTQHSQIIEILFGMYFHVLKRRPNNSLNAVVLEGLAKFAHLVNIEFFSDLLNVLAKLMEEGTLKFRESLHCIQTVFTIMSDQGEALSLDPRRFYSYLYANLFRLTEADNQENLPSALQSLMQMLVIRRKRVSEVRVTAFIKRLTGLSLGVLHHGAVSSLATARYIMLTHPGSEVLREADPEGASGVFNPEAEEPEYCNASASCLWELHLLNRHYHNTVRQLADHISRGAPLQGEGQLPARLGKRRVQDLFDDFDPSEMKFNPTIPSPSQYLSKRMLTESKVSVKRIRWNQFKTQFMANEVQNVFKSEEDPFAITDRRYNGISKKNGNLVDNGINYFKCMLPNVDLSKVKTTLPVADEEDATASLVDVDLRT